MGKQKKKDRMYIRAGEWAAGEGGQGSGKMGGLEAENHFQRLPFDCCAISLRPAENPVCTVDGTVFDVLNIIPWIKKHGTDPTTGKQLKGGDLFKIQFHRSPTSGEICDPVTFKEFNYHTHIVAIRTSGNVYSYESVQELNLKSKNFTDLVTGEKFTRKDIVTLQDPHNFEKKNLVALKQLKEEREEPPEVRDGIRANEATSRILDELAKKDAAAAPKTTTAASGFDGKRLPKGEKKKAIVKKAVVKAKPAEESLSTKQKNRALAHYSTGAMAASFTSTAVPAVYVNETAYLPEEKIKPAKAKGYVTIDTNLGALNFELHCDLVPIACTNFINLAKQGYYDTTIFHRSIRNFMIQGGDPTGTGKGGESSFENGEPFEDEFKPQLTHDGRGILAMANSGKNTNKSQFYITYRSAPHLNNKHTVFGKMVGGREVLNKIERVDTDNDDRPLEKIAIKTVTVFVDPFADEKAAEEAEEQKEEVKEDPTMKVKGQWFSNPALADRPAATKEGVGKYVDAAGGSTEKFLQSFQGGDAVEPAAKRKKVVKAKGQFGDFSGW